MIAVIALVVVIILLGVGLRFWLSSSAATGTSGGVTAGGHPQDASVGSSGSSAPVVVAAAVPPVTVPLVNRIHIIKDTTGKTVTPPASRTFQIGEIKAYRADGSLLTADDYSGAEYGMFSGGGVAVTYPAKNAFDGNVNTFTHTNGEESSIHELKLTLRNPTNIGRVEVINRVDCCADRLAGTVIQLIAENGTVLKSMTLTDAATQTLA
jgi:hypothetical protein